MVRNEPRASVYGRIRQVSCKGCDIEFLTRQYNKDFHNERCKNDFHKRAHDEGVKKLQIDKQHHCGVIKNSLRLQRMLGALIDGKPHTSRELRDLADTTGVSRDIDDLRKNGKNITCTYVGMTDSKRKVYEYTLLPF